MVYCIRCLSVCASLAGKLPRELGPLTPSLQTAPPTPDAKGFLAVQLYCNPHTFVGANINTVKYSVFIVQTNHHRSANLCRPTKTSARAGTAMACISTHSVTVLLSCCFPYWYTALRQHAYCATFVHTQQS